MSRRARLLLLAVLGGGACLVGVELLITAVALPRILADLADWTQLRRASWIVNGYLLAYIATMPLAGRAGDRFGLPWLFSASLFLFAIGSLLAGAAQDLDQLVAARVVQGIGAGAIVPLATAGASHLFEGAARARALGVVGALTFLGMALGPFAGAAVLETFELGSQLTAAGLEESLAFSVLVPSWRWIFYLGAPLALLAIAYTWAAAPAWPRAKVPGGLDLAGAALFTLALAALLLGLLGLGDDAVTEPSPPLFLGVAAVAAVLAAVRLARARHPFLDLRHFRSRPFSGAVLLSLLTGYGLATAIVGGAVFVDRVRYAGPDEQRLVLGSLAGAMALGALLSGFVLRWIGVVAVSLAGLAISVGGLVLVALASPATPGLTIAGSLALFGFGFGLTVTPRSTAAVEALGRSAFGVASAGVTVARMIGMAGGLAVLTAFGSNRIEALSVVLVDPVARDQVLPEVLRGRPLEDGLVVEALEVWAADQAAGILGGLFAVAAIVTAVAVVPALLMRGGGRARVRGDGMMEARPGPEDRDDAGQAALAL